MTAFTCCAVNAAVKKYNSSKLPCTAFVVSSEAMYSGWDVAVTGLTPIVDCNAPLKYNEADPPLLTTATWNHDPYVMGRPPQYATEPPAPTKLMEFCEG